MTAGAFACQPVAGRRGQAHGITMVDKDKEERLAAALRENLRKRKAQARSSTAKAEDDKAQ
jgi:hypothetical protein